MRTLYDDEADALYVRFAEGSVADSKEVAPGIVFDYDGEGRIVAVEILDASVHLAKGTDFRDMKAA
jgi:uncharacterized protein YuzE